MQWKCTNCSIISPWTLSLILKTCLIWPRKPGPLVAFRCFLASRFCARVGFPVGYAVSGVLYTVFGYFAMVLSN